MNGLKASSKMKKYALIGFVSIFMPIFICAEANHSISSHSRNLADIHHERQLLITRTAVNLICSTTDYKEDCRMSLITVRSPDPRSLIKAAFDLAISSIRSGIDRGLLDINAQGEADIQTIEALNTSRELMDDAIDDIRRTRDKFGGFLFIRLSDFVEDLCVWLSGSITYQQTCIDGFEGINSNAAMIMERVLRKGQHLTSNGLAIASNLDTLLKIFRIPIPFLRSRRDRLGTFGSDSTRESGISGSSEDPPSDSSDIQPLDSPEDSALDSSPRPPLDSSTNPPLDSSQNQPLDSSTNQPLNPSEKQPIDSSANQPVDSSANKPLDSSEKQPLDSSANQPLDSSANRPINSTENQPIDSSANQPLDSSAKRPLDSSDGSSQTPATSENGQSDSSGTQPLDPLGLRKLNPFGKSDTSKERHLSEEEDFPRWVSAHSRRMLQRRGKGKGRGRGRGRGGGGGGGGGRRGIRANVVVAKDGNIKTITQALAMVPMNNKRRFIIHIKQGVYREKVEVTKKMLHVMFVGDGPTKTIITGDVAFLPNRVGTFRTATVAVNGDYFMARDIGFENTAGAARHQAVALRVSADFAVFFNCRMDGHQDTLYVHTHRQFYRDCRISGTIDFVFGDAKAVFQNCEFVIRPPMPNQQCIVTAQGRKDRRETTGIVIHNSRIVGDPAYRPLKAKNRAFLGRPWKEYSRTIIMNTMIDDVIDPEGWLRWDTTMFGLNTAYYGEFRNTGPGAGLARRVRWRGIKRITDRDARQFAPGAFLRGSTWIPETRVPYNPN